MGFDDLIKKLNLDSIITEKVDVVNAHYDETIENILMDDCVVTGNYEFPKVSSSIRLKDDDLDKFKLLYTQNMGNQTIGFGELALYWLFNYQHRTGPIINNSPMGDLELKDGTKLEIKSYSKNGFMVIGKWASDTYGRKIINNLFSIYNIDNIFKNGSFKSELGFNKTQILDAIASNIELKTKFDEIPEYFVNEYSLLRVIKNALEFNDEIFNELMKSRGRKRIQLSKNNIEEIAKESIADIIYGIVKSKILGSSSRGTDGKINQGGYLINVVRRGRYMTGELDFYRVNGISKDTTNLITNFSVSGGEIKIKPALLI